MDSTHAFSAAELATHLADQGVAVTLDENDERLIIALDAGRSAVVRWRGGTRAVQIAVATGIRVPSEQRGGAMLEVARVNGELDAPGFVIDLEDGDIEYRSRLMCGEGGGLELEVLEASLGAALGCVERVAQRLARVLGRSRHSAELHAATAFAGYSE